MERNIVPIKKVALKNTLNFFRINSALILSAIKYGGNQEKIKKKWMDLRLEIARKTYENYKQELEDPNNLLQILKKINDEFPHKEINTNIAYHVGLYILVRTLKPHTAIETGVAIGDSSALILLGMHDNGFGESERAFSRSQC